LISGRREEEQREEEQREEEQREEEQREEEVFFTFFFFFFSLPESGLRPKYNQQTSVTGCPAGHFQQHFCCIE
jgi:hypothetical protein